MALATWATSWLHPCYEAFQSPVGNHCTSRKEVEWHTEYSERLSLLKSRLLHRRNNRGDRGRLFPQLLDWGEQQCIGPPTFWPYFSKSKKFQSKYYYFSVRLSHSTSITSRSANILVNIQPATDLALNMLAVCSDTRPLEPTNERRSHQNAGFSI